MPVNAKQLKQKISQGRMADWLPKAMLAITTSGMIALVILVLEYSCYLFADCNQKRPTPVILWVGLSFFTAGVAIVIPTTASDTPWSRIWKSKGLHAEAVLRAHTFRSRNQIKNLQTFAVINAKTQLPPELTCICLEYHDRFAFDAK